MKNTCDSCVYSAVEGDQEPCATCCAPTNHWTPMLRYNPEDVAFPRGIGIQSAGGVKYDNDKPQWSLLPFKALKEVVDVLQVHIP